MPTPFVNEPFANFDDPAVASRMQKAIDHVRSQLGQEYPLLIDGKKVKTGTLIDSLDPSNPDQIVGRVAEGTREHAEQAMQAALKAFDSWRNVSAEDRATLLFKAAKMIRDNKFEYAAWMVFEVGKSWAEATVTSPRPSISSSSTDARRCVSRTSSRSRRTRAKTISSRTFRSASAR